MIKFGSIAKAKLAPPTPAPRPKSIMNKVGGTKKSPLQAKTIQQKASLRRTTVELSAYGNRLFEPTAAKTIPLIVEFVEYWSVDGCRFSKDGFFSIKYLVDEKKCFLYYFDNPVKVTEELNLADACKEAITFKEWEFENDADYLEVPKGEEASYVLLQKARIKSALGKVEAQVVAILKDKIIAEKFIKRQRLVDKQDAAWEDYKKQQEARDLELAQADAEFLKGEQNAGELESTTESSIEEQPEIKLDEQNIETKQEVQTLPKETKEVPKSNIPSKTPTPIRGRSLLDIMNARKGIK